jgi:putative phosphoesterase
MRVGIVSDLHCNAPALAMAIRRMGDVDELWCVGDIQLEYRFDNEVVELLRDHAAHCVLGNHDLGLLSAQGERARTAPAVRSANLDYLMAQPLSIDRVIGGRRFLMTHASPCPPHTQYVWPGSPHLAELARVDADFIILGHTHVQMAVRVGRALVINPGSTGEPRDRANGLRSSYAVLDTDTGDVGFDDYQVGSPA